MESVCPTCSRRIVGVETEHRYRPFCSRRCKMTDLGNWFDEVYRFSRPVDEDDISESSLTRGEILRGGNDDDRGSRR